MTPGSTAGVTAARGVAGLVLLTVAARLVGLPWRLLEGMLITAVIGWVAWAAPVRQLLRGLGRARMAALGGMLTVALLGQLGLGDRSFPFIAWRMYGIPPKVTGGSVSNFEYDLALQSSRRVALVPGHYLAAESADRFTEALRRQVERLKRAGGDPRATAWRAEQAATLGALTRRYDERHPSDRVARVLVLERRVTPSSGARSAPMVLWEVVPT